MYRIATEQRGEHPAGTSAILVVVITTLPGEFTSLMYWPLPYLYIASATDNRRRFYSNEDGAIFLGALYVFEIPPW